MTEADILQMAKREASPEHYAEFQPITRGPIFAMLALGPLCALAAVCVVWRKLMGYRPE